MNIKAEKLQMMIELIDEIIQQAAELEKQYAPLLEKVQPRHYKSAQNLIHYRAMRQFDLRPLQKQLGYLGFSRLAKAEGHVMASLLTTRSLLKSLLKHRPLELPAVPLSPKKGQKLANSNAKELLGYRSKGRRTRIMVTMPSEAATDSQLVHQLLQAGMNSARINCAHDNAESWRRMIEHIRQAENKTRRHCKVCMDLAGPKIRTGPVAEGPRLLRIRVRKNALGQPLEPTRVWLGTHPSTEAAYHVPIPPADLQRLKPGHKLRFRDSRNKKRSFLIEEKTETGCWASCIQNIYLLAHTPMYLKGDEKPIVVGELPQLEMALNLKVGELLYLHAPPLPGEEAMLDESGKLLRPAHISCTLPEVFQYVEVGQRVLFDDGKITTVVQSREEDGLMLKIVHSSGNRARLRADKGINFPDSELAINGLTEKDRSDLEFVCQQADVVNMSFVKQAEDVQQLLEELDKHGARDRMGIILKIETRKGFQNLTEILLTAMQARLVGVMIARGDLAIEVGWEQVGRIQEEILWLCEAAHAPNIWATQVLESLAKKGLPSRAEITDATMAQRAECVMLNKGPFILDAIALLDAILKNMHRYQEKKAPFLPAMEG